MHGTRDFNTVAAFLCLSYIR